MANQASMARRQRERQRIEDQIARFELAAMQQSTDLLFELNVQRYPVGLVDLDRQ